MKRAREEDDECSPKRLNNSIINIELGNAFNDDVQQILNNLKVFIENCINPTSIQFQITHEVVSYFNSSEVEDLKRFDDFLKGLSTLLDQRFGYKSEISNSVFAKSLQFAYKFAVLHNFVGQQNFLESNESYMQYIGSEMIEEMERMGEDHLGL